MAGAPVVRVSTIAAKQQHPSWSHAGRLPWAEASLQPRKPEQQEHSHTHPAVVLLPANKVLRLQSQRGISLQSNCDLMGTFRGFSGEEVTNNA